MKFLTLILIVFCSHHASAELASTKPAKKIRTVPNVEVQARLIKHNKNYLYMASETETIKIKKSELTKEGVRQILKNKDKELTIFIPEKSVVDRVPRPKK